MRTSVQKPKARSARSLAEPGDDHALGLWVDYDPLRTHQHRTSDGLHKAWADGNSRYLELADLALGNKKIRTKSKNSALVRK